MSDEKWAVVLGATSGAGEAIARLTTSRPGLHVFGVHRGNHAEAAAALEAQGAALGRRVHLRRAEGGTAEAAEAGAEELLAIAGPGSVRLFVHAIANASVGLFLHGDPWLRPDQIERTFASMAHSFVWWTQALQRRDLLDPAGARLLGLTSPLGESIIRNVGAISAAKAALEVYVRHLAFELGPRGHRVNLLKYGATRTTALGRVLPEAKLNHLESQLRRMTPAHRACTVEDVARFVAVLAGDDAAWFNGATIDFTGGEVQSLYDLVLHPDEEALE